MPERIQRRRTAGWRMPEGAVYVGRPTKWGNEFAVGDEVRLDIGGAISYFRILDRQHAVNLFRSWQATSLPIPELRGKDLACWCPLDQPCHADVLLALANRRLGTESTLLKSG